MSIEKQDLLINTRKVHPGKAPDLHSFFVNIGKSDFKDLKAGWDKDDWGVKDIKTMLHDRKENAETKQVLRFMLKASHYGKDVLFAALEKIEATHNPETGMIKLLTDQELKELMFEVRGDARKEMIESQKKNADLYKTFNDKVYKNADQWHDPRMFNQMCIRAMLQVADLKKDEDKNDAEFDWILSVEKLKDLPFETRLMAVLAMDYGNHLNTPMFVAPALFRAALQTRPPNSLDWKRMKLPYESGVFMLPKGALKSPSGKDIMFLSWLRLSAKVVRDICKKVPADHRDRFVICGMDEKNTDVYTYNIEIDFSMDHINHANLIDEKTTPAVRAAINTMAALTFNLLLLLDVKPEIRDPLGEVMLGQAKKSRKDLWSPNVIGRGYRYETHAPIGTHASPRWHWRRGHWREQGIGRLMCKMCLHPKAAHDRETGLCRYPECLQKECRRRYKHEDNYRTWIEPILVNFNEGEEVQR